MAGIELRAGAAAEIPVLVIGAGQAGLATGYHLARAGIGYRIIDANRRVGDSWRQRYASLELFTPRWMSALPGLAVDGEPDGFSTGDAFANYLENYAQTFDIPVENLVRATRLGRGVGGGLDVETSAGEVIRAGRVVITTGGFQQPVVPTLASGFDGSVASFTTATYRWPAQIEPGTVLVVGDGATGRDIAAELAPTRLVLLATGRSRKLLPEKIFGRSTWWWLSRLGLMGASSASSIGRLMRRADPFPDRDRGIGALRRKGVRIKPRLVGAQGNLASFADGSTEPVSSVVWAVGYRDDTDWVDIPGASVDRSFIHARGISPVEGLFFVGRPWQRNRASALVHGAGADAAEIVKAMVGGARR